MLTHRSSKSWLRMAVALAVLPLAAAQSVAAQEAGEWYGGIGFGSAHVEVYRGSLFGFGAWEEGSSDAAMLAFGGRRFNEHFAVELAYLLPADVDWREDGAYIDDLPGVYDSRTSLSTSAIQLSALGIWPFAERWHAYAKGGVSAYRSEGSQTLTDFYSGATLSRSIDSSDSGLLLGIGVGMTPSDRWRVRLEYQFFYIDNTLINVEPDNDPTFDSWFFSIDYRFGRR